MQFILRKQQSCKVNFSRISAMAFAHKQDEMRLHTTRTIGKSKVVPIPMVIIEKKLNEESDRRKSADESSIHNHELSRYQRHFSQHPKPTRILQRVLSEISMDSTYSFSCEVETLKGATRQPQSLDYKVSNKNSISHSFSQCVLPHGRPLQAAPKLVSAVPKLSSVNCGSTISNPTTTHVNRQKKPCLKRPRALKNSRKFSCHASGSMWKGKIGNGVATVVPLSNNDVSLQ
mmetsp:Transcript_4286/g.6151  ORF Transcript_4286/g.6151 Transcript_4286/m.6151 type:complete len:231 (+) Transcript_4286:400-1092(+)